MHTQTIPTGPQTQIDFLSLMRELTDHLTGYAISPTNFDDEALATCEKAERLMFDAKLDRRSDCCRRPVDEINEFDVCRGCGRPCSEEQ